MDFDSHSLKVATAAIAMVNEVTPGHRGGKPVGVPVDLCAALVRALATAGAQWDQTPDPESARALAGYALRLRSVVERVDAGEVAQACQDLNALIREVGAVPTLVSHDDGPWHLHFHAADAPWATGWAASMATALAVVLGNPAIDRLGICLAPACDRVYLDTSRNGSKRFCSTTCQNRVKAAAFRARQTR